MYFIVRRISPHDLGDESDESSTMAVFFQESDESNGSVKFLPSEPILVGLPCGQWVHVNTRF